MSAAHERLEQHELQIGLKPLESDTKPKAETVALLASRPKKEPNLPSLEVRAAVRSLGLGRWSFSLWFGPGNPGFGCWWVGRSLRLSPRGLSRISADDGGGTRCPKDDQNYDKLHVIRKPQLTSLGGLRRYSSSE